MFISKLLLKYPELNICKTDIIKSINLLYESVITNNRLYFCGNGGSSADADHIVGELLKGFLLNRDLAKNKIDKILEHYPEDSEEIIRNIQEGVPAISLSSQTAFLTAYANDKDINYAYAQQVYVFGNRNDVLFAISTSGNSKNIINACKIAKIKKLKIIGLTGKTGGELADYCNVCIRVPSDYTPEIQEYHLPVYHAICAELENKLYSK